MGPWAWGNTVYILSSHSLGRLSGTSLLGGSGAPKILSHLLSLLTGWSGEWSQRFLLVTFDPNKVFWFVSVRFGGIVQICTRAEGTTNLGYVAGPAQT